jgi:hypothetical protein
VAGYGGQFTYHDTSNRREGELRSPGRWLASIQSPVFVFEGTVQGNIESLQKMARASSNANAHFLSVKGATHFSILAPTTRLLAEKILRDDGATTNLNVSEEEVNRLFSK